MKLLFVLLTVACLIAGCHKNENEKFLIDFDRESSAVSLCRAGQVEHWSLDAVANKFELIRTQRLAMPVGAKSYCSLPSSSLFLCQDRGKFSLCVNQDGRITHLPDVHGMRKSRSEVWLAFDTQERIEDCGEALAAGRFSEADLGQLTNPRWRSPTYCRNARASVAFCRNGAPVILDGGVPEAVLDSRSDNSSWIKLNLAITPEFLHLPNDFTCEAIQLDVSADYKSLIMSQASKHEVTFMVWSVETGQVLYKVCRPRENGFLNDCFFEGDTAVFATGSEMYLRYGNSNSFKTTIRLEAAFARLLKVDENYVYYAFSDTPTEGFKGFHRTNIR